MNFVDENNDVAASANFLKHFLKAFFEISAVTATSNEGTKVKCVELLIFERLWDISLDDCLCKTFNHGRLTNARLTNKNWIILGAT
ncbi:unannotated protein [freshwater metagenome]|uniref:Unannotated protein n=1 Tax=freshwater metagenome TaxID=449393 RepID=A0A6J7SGT8_9ZZZZ